MGTVTERLLAVVPSGEHRMVRSSVPHGEPLHWRPKRSVNVQHETDKHDWPNCGRAKVGSEHKRPPAKHSLDLDAAACCFCGKPMSNQEPVRHRVNIQMIDGNSLDVQYHGECLREWLGENGPALPVGSELDP